MEGGAGGDGEGATEIDGAGAAGEVEGIGSPGVPAAALGATATSGMSEATRTMILRELFIDGRPPGSDVALRACFRGDSIENQQRSEGLEPVTIPVRAQGAYVVPTMHMS